jgi:hypothetical protein
MSAQMPTFLAFKDGVKINETVGANPPALNVRSHPSSLLLSSTAHDLCRRK